MRDVADLGFSAMDVWTAHVSPQWVTQGHLTAAREVLGTNGSDASPTGTGRDRSPAERGDDLHGSETDAAGPGVSPS